MTTSLRVCAICIVFRIRINTYVLTITMPCFIARHISLKQICSDVFKEMLYPTKSDAKSDRFVEIWQSDKVAHQFTVNKVNVLFYRCKERHATWHDFTVVLHTTIKQPLRTNNNVMLSIHCRN